MRKLISAIYVWKTLDSETDIRITRISVAALVDNDHTIMKLNEAASLSDN